MAETVCPPCIRGRHPQLDYLTRPKKSSWATNYDGGDDGVDNHDDYDDIDDYDDVDEDDWDIGNLKTRSATTLMIANFFQGISWNIVNMHFVTCLLGKSSEDKFRPPIVL